MAIRTEPALLFGKVMHQRLFPKRNRFLYGIYYLYFPLSKISELADAWRFGVNRFGLMSFYGIDHGDRHGGDLEGWARQILSTYKMNDVCDGEIVLVTMPRVFGHVFNPVSFWLCHDSAGFLRAVLCEVNNTFGETHVYLCAHADQRPITPEDEMTAAKVFHVSPFLPREGSYRFKFSSTPDRFSVLIDYYAANGEKQLLTTLSGSLADYNRKNRSRAFWQHPMVALIALVRIHWHAVRLLFKGVRYVPKPLQKKDKVTAATDLKKM